ncbi:hypothetical protein ACI79P_05920 [Blastococcus sp. SYSU DS0510]
MSWVLILIVVWVAVALAVALVLGRSIRLADQRTQAALDRSLEMDSGLFTEPSVPRPARSADDLPSRIRRSAAAPSPPHTAEPYDRSA